MRLSFGDKTQKAGCWQYLALRQRSDLRVLSQKTNADASTRSGGSVESRNKIANFALVCFLFSNISNKKNQYICYNETIMFAIETKKNVCGRE